MSETENVRQALESAASNPKVASTVAAATAAMGTVSLMSEIQTLLGMISLTIGCIVGLYVLRINSIKYKIYKRMWEDEESFKE